MNDLPSEEDLKRQIMLTSTIAWKNDLTETDIEKWLSNFKGEVYSKNEERRLALWLLTNFVFYNRNEVLHLCKTLYRDYIHSILINSYDNKISVTNSIRAVLNTSRFYHLGRPGESGAYVLYMFRQANNLPMDNFIYHPNELPLEVSTIVFVDDVTLSEGSKSQAAGYIEDNIKRYFQGKNIVLLTFIATEKAIKALANKGITVISCIVLGKRNECFSEYSNVFHYFKNHCEKCKIFAEHYGRKVKPQSSSLGFNNSQFAFGFFYNTPDNTLPIFWAENNEWHPIIKRYDKEYAKGKYNEFERFV